jgi:hypothetical protein
LNLLADNLDQDFGYIPSTRDSGVIGDFIFNDLNADGVQDLGESGMEGVRVSLLSSTGGLLDSVLTDENGKYLFTGLDPSATYQIVVDTSSLPGGSGGWTNTADPDGLNNAATTVDLSLIVGGITLDQDFGFNAAINNRIGGTVWQEIVVNGLLTDGTSGGSADETGNGLMNVRIILRDSNGNIVASQFTDANGDYLFSGLPDGTYTVEVDDVNNVLANMYHTDGPNPGANNNSQDDTGYPVSVSGGELNETGDFGYAPVVTTPVTLASFVATYDSVSDSTTIKWSTVTETGNLGFEISYKENNQWLSAPVKVVAAKGIYSEKPILYQIVIHGIQAEAWQITDVDINNKRVTHGPYYLGHKYGDELLNQQQSINWQLIKQKSDELKSQRDDNKKATLNQLINAKKQQANGETK